MAEKESLFRRLWSKYFWLIMGLIWIFNGTMGIGVSCYGRTKADVSALARMIKKEPKTITKIEYRRVKEGINLFLYKKKKKKPVRYYFSSKVGSRVVELAVHHKIKVLNKSPKKGILIDVFWIVLGLINIIIFLYKRDKMREEEDRKAGKKRKGKSFFRKLNTTLKDDVTLTFDPVVPKERFKDVAGLDPVIKELQRLVGMLKGETTFSDLGAVPQKGVLLEGPAGVGKTLVVKALAGEADVPFFAFSGSSFDGKWIGQGPANIRALFEVARDNAPSIVFIDEIDGLGSKRSRDESGHQSHSKTLNQLLAEMDGVHSEEDVLVIAATNFAGKLDPALVRPGRFDLKVNIPLPDHEARMQILEVTLKSRETPLADDVDLNILSLSTPGFSGAELANMVNEATIMAGDEKAKEVSMRHLDKARDQEIMGKSVKRKIPPAMQRKVAEHEAGHALIAMKAEHAPTIYKVTCEPNGYYGGVLVPLPREEFHLMTRVELIHEMAVLMGGRMAEEHFHEQNVSIGASDDFQKVNNIATRMVMEWGFGERSGQYRAYAQRGEGYHGGEKGSDHSPQNYDLTSELQKDIDKLVKEAKELAEGIFNEGKPLLEAIANELYEQKTLTRKDLEAIETQVNAQA